MIRDARMMKAAVIGGAALLTGIIVAVGGLGSTAVWLGLVVGIPVFLVAVSNAQFGAFVIFSVGYLLLGVKRASPGIPLGLLADFILLALILGVILRRSESHDWSMMKSPIAIMAVVWLLYTFLQFFNPAACSTLPWLYNIRSVAVYLLMYFIAVDVIDRPKRLSFWVWFFVAWGVIGALYAFKQEFIGLADFEYKWVWDPSVKRYHLLYQWGLLRKFSFFSDPVSFGMTMSLTGIMCWAIAFGAPGIGRKIAATIALVLIWWAMVYSGTRSAYMAIPLGLFFYAVLMTNKRMYVAGAFGAVFILFLILVPTQNQHLKRFRSAFQPTESKSYTVRIENQRFIRPYIWSHPFGGGLGATGETSGERFCPGSILAQFPPDSGYVRIAVELGWVGLLLHLGVWIAVLGTGVRNQFRLRDPYIKTLSGGAISMFFALAVVSYAQQTIFQLPMSLLFWFIAALIDRVPVLDAMKMRELETARDAGVAARTAPGISAG